MTNGPGMFRGAPGLGRPGVVDHRLARRSLISEFRKGRLAQHQVCDAHPELVRNAEALGDLTRVDCPICASDKLVLVTYVFGPRLPAHGRCISSKAELRKLNTRADDLAAYIVEVCRTCRWHHLLQVVPMGGKKPRRAEA
jgi:hypothetical protein